MSPRARLPLAPLLDRVVAVAGMPIHQRVGCPACGGDTTISGSCLRVIDIAEMLGISSKGLNRWTAEGGVPVDRADEIAIRLGWHPAVVWGHDWAEELELACER